MLRKSMAIAPLAAGALLLYLYVPATEVRSTTRVITARQDYGPGDLPAVVQATKMLAADVVADDANSLYTPENKGRIVPEFSGDPPHEGLWSKMANEGDLHTVWASRNAELLHVWTGRLHRKTWELVYILEVVNSLKKCEPGSKGLVFAAGREPLASRFAQQGCSIHATDFPTEATGGSSNSWVQTNQHASLGMYEDWFGPKEEFDRLVTYEGLDMNFLESSKSLQPSSFDFVWSTCSVEHLGSVSLGKRFVMGSMAYLKPGGVAVHTFEFTLSRLQSGTQRHGETALWTRSDAEGLARDLCFLGYEVLPLRFEAGTGNGDLNPDAPPYEGENKTHPHVKLWLFDQICTAFALVVRKPVGHRQGKQHDCHSLYAGR